MAMSSIPILRSPSLFLLIFAFNEMNVIAYMTNEQMLYKVSTVKLEPTQVIRGVVIEKLR